MLPWSQDILLQLTYVTPIDLLCFDKLFVIKCTCVNAIGGPFNDVAGNGW